MLADRCTDGTWKGFTMKEFLEGTKGDDECTVGV